MRRVWPAYRTAILSTVLAAFLAAAPAAAQPLQTTKVDLRTLGGTHSAAADVNDHTIIVGYSATSSGAHHAFYWQAGVMTDLGTLGGEYSLAEDLNELGRAVGLADTRPTGAPNPHAVYWKP